MASATTSWEACCCKANISCCRVALSSSGLGFSVAMAFRLRLLAIRVAIRIFIWRAPVWLR